MALEKITADFNGRAEAMQAASALQDLIEPAPDALTVSRQTATAYINDP